MGSSSSIPNPPVWFGDATAVTTVAATTTLSVTPPASVPAGALMLMQVAVCHLTPTITTPDGWSAVGSVIDGPAGSPIRSYLYRKIAAGNDGAFDVVKVGTDSGSTYRASLVVITGGTFVSAGTYAASANSSTHDLPTVTPTAPNSMRIGMMQYRGNNYTSAWATLTEELDTGGLAPNANLGYIIQQTPAASGTERLTSSPSANAACGYHVIVAPA